VLPNIILIGFMGSGKSTVGRKLASITGHRFVDTDDRVAEAENASISEIFSACGESYFRDCEQRALEDLTGVCGLVVSTGGGIILRPGNVDRLHQLGVVAWIDAAPETLFERAIRSGRRPLLKVEEPRTRFLDLLNQRQLLYEQAADFRVDSTDLDHHSTAQAILDQARQTIRTFEG